YSYTSERQRQADFILLARLDLVRKVCEELRAGQSPIPRLYRAQISLEQDDGSAYRHEEIQFIESILGRLLVGTPDTERTFAPKNDPPSTFALAGAGSSFGRDFN
ncbi:MAG TPA: hypothetical protein VK786_04425, partial [bacterium]|nr:hypothetical protein [bacterium]